MSLGMNSRSARVEGMSVPNTKEAGLREAIFSRAFGTSSFTLPNPVALIFAPGGDEIENDRKAGFGHAEMTREPAHHFRATEFGNSTSFQLSRGRFRKEYRLPASRSPTAPGFDCLSYDHTVMKYMAH